MTADEPANPLAGAESRSRASRTLTVGEVVERLSRLDHSLPVVFEAEDEPLGSYGVRDISVVPMQRTSIHAAEPYGCDVYFDPAPARKPGEYYDEPGPVALLSINRIPINPRPAGGAGHDG